MPSEHPYDSNSDDESRSSPEERYTLDEDEAAPTPNPDADKGPDAHIGGGRSLDAPEEKDESEEALEEARAIDQVGRATGELPDDVEPINATGFTSTDQEVSNLAETVRGDDTAEDDEESSSD